MDVEIAAAICLCAVSYYNFLNIYYKKKIRKPWRKRRWWMITMHRNRNRSSMENQLAELVAEPSGQFNNFTRMSLSDFEYLLQKVSPLISKANTLKREAIPAKIRLAITLRFLASGDSFESLHFLFKVSSSIISRIVPEVCIALNQVLKDQIRLVVFCVVGVAVAARLPNVYRYGQEAQLLRYDNDNDGLGNYRFGFEQTDGTKHEQRGELKNEGREDESIVVTGRYSWIAPDGERYTVIYVADDNGYHPVVQHAPGGPPQFGAPPTAALIATMLGG